MQGQGEGGERIDYDVADDESELGEWTTKNDKW